VPSDGPGDFLERLPRLLGLPLDRWSDEDTLRTAACPARPGRAEVVLDLPDTELLFQVLTEREEKNSVAIASNELFGGWTKTFTDPRLCAAIVDRLTFGGNIIETGTDSHRLATARARARAEQPAAG